MTINKISQHIMHYLSYNKWKLYWHFVQIILKFSVKASTPDIWTQLWLTPGHISMKGCFCRSLPILVFCRNCNQAFGKSTKLALLNRKTCTWTLSICHTSPLTYHTMGWHRSRCQGHPGRLNRSRPQENSLCEENQATLDTKNNVHK